MIYVTSIVDEDVLPKIDTQYVMSELSSVGMDAVIVFICTNEHRRQEDSWNHRGETYHTIRLPYQTVKTTDDVRPLMLRLAAKKLGISLPGESGGNLRQA